MLISGKSPFCETFFENVAVPKENLVGALNRGWDVAKYLLTHEREMIAGGGSLYDIHALDREAASQAKGAKLTNPILRAGSPVRRSTPTRQRPLGSDTSPRLQAVAKSGRGRRCSNTTVPSSTNAGTSS